MDRIYTPLALKLHAYGLTNLHDPNWTGCDLFDRLKQHVRGRVEPFDLLYKTLNNGLLYHLGLWIQEDYFDSDHYLIATLKDEYRAWYLEDIVEAIIKFENNSKKTESIQDAQKLLEKIDALYDVMDDEEYFNFLDSEEGVDQIINCYENIHNEFTSIIPEFFHLYSLDYAERVFHDRQLCAFISELLVSIGFDGMDLPHDTHPKQWIERKKWPQWAVKAVRARDRGYCAECGVNPSIELHDDENIDHIVPLSKGGTNDLVNLQLLCKTCNSKKYNKEQFVKTSIPPYLKGLRKKKV